ncbi:MAG: M20 family metallopeptidase [Gemmatimonadota bacterium]
MSQERAQEILAYLEDRREAMVDLLVTLAGMETPSDVPHAQKGIQAVLARHFHDLGLHVRPVPGRATGGHLLAAPAERIRGRPLQMMLGHMDTVWPLGTLDEMPVVVEGGVVRGPGTFDMKGGLVQMIFALEALRAAGAEPEATPVIFVNSDEEIGSPESKRWVATLARIMCRVFVVEPALGPEGKLKTARKGVANYTVRAVGKAAHAGLDPTGGVSAIEELAYHIPELHSLTDLDRGVTVNVGVIQGGTRPNVIAAEAWGEVDVRILTREDAVGVEAAIRGLEPRLEGARLEVDGGLKAPPMERTPGNRALWRAAQRAALRLGLKLDEVTSGGGSDGNTTSQFAPTLDGLGPVGDGAHARHEHLLVDFLVERTALLAELLMEPLETE